MNKMLKILSLLLSYPTAELVEDSGAIARAARELPGLSVETRQALLALLDELGRSDLMDSQERYVHLFDRTRSLSLHLFEHVHGESRDRGQAMVDLMGMYDEAGFMIAARELPDYLPLFLEFLSTRNAEVISDLLGSTAHILAALAERVAKREPLYAAPFAALVELSGAVPEPALLDALRAVAPDDPDDLKALDAIWEDEAVTFGGNAGEAACGPDRLRSQIRAARRPPEDVASATRAH